MCFYLSETTITKVATKDIVVYKNTDQDVSKDYFKSNFSDFTYERGELNKEVKLTVRDKYFQGRSQGESIEEGYHSFISNPHEHYFYVSGIFVIPKGSTYYENKESNERVSSQLVYLGLNTFLNRLKIKHLRKIVINEQASAIEAIPASQSTF